MARYNSKAQKAPTTVVNHQGGTSVKLQPKVELLGILLTGFDNTFYEKIGDREKRLQSLIQDLSEQDLDFVAKALVYARSVVGQRTVTHFGSAVLAQYISGEKLGKSFFSKRHRKANKGGIVHRLDDMLEIIACYQHLNPGKRLTNAMRKGFKSALESADRYEIAKYQGKSRKVSLVDVVNLVHPSPTKEMEATFKELMNGTLKQFNTVEDQKSKAGQEVSKLVKSGEITKEEGEKILTEKKAETYRTLVEDEKIGYLALLRNVIHILNNNPTDEIIESTCKSLTDRPAIRKSLVMPYQIDIALEFILLEARTGLYRNKILEALDKAYEMSVPNMEALALTGTTAVVFDCSGSMTARVKLSTTHKSTKSALEKAVLIAATFAKGLGADVYEFDDTCRKRNYNPNDSVNTIKRGIVSGRSGGTSFDSIFRALDKRYDRVIVISDMQGRDDILRRSSYQTYIGKYGRPNLYAIDLCGYGTSMFKQDSKSFQLFGYSSEMYEVFKKLEIDMNALIKEVEKIEI